MRFLSRILAMIKNEKAEKAIKDAKINREEISSKVNDIVATLDGEDKWFIEPHSGETKEHDRKY